MNKEHLKLKNEISIFFLCKHAFLTENHTCLEILKTSILSFGYPGFQKYLEEEVHPISPRTLFLVTTNVRGNPVLTQVSKKYE